MAEELQADYLYSSGICYDLLYPTATDVPFWLEQARRYGGPVLELACGTGRVSIPLARAGYEVTGIDIAGAMLAAAREKSQNEGLEVTWVHGDIRDFDLGRRFSLIILPANALCHLLTLSDFERMAACVRRHLRPEGRFIVSVFVPSFAVLQRDPAGAYEFGEYVRPEDGEPVQIWYRNRYRADTQINHIQLFVQEPDGKERAGGDLDMRMYFPQELDALLKYNGLPVERKYGDLDETPFGPSSEQQLPVCTLS